MKKTIYILFILSWATLSCTHKHIEKSKETIVLPKISKTTSFDSFAIYLPLFSDPTSLQDPLYINRVHLQPEPLINLDDIVSYDWISHTVTLNKKIKYDKDHISYPLVVCVGHNRIYLCYIWYAILSSGTTNPVIELPNYSAHYIPRVFQIERCYPDLPEFRTSPDPRNDIRILNALTNARKIKITSAVSKTD